MIRLEYKDYTCISQENKKFPDRLYCTIYKPGSTDEHFDFFLADNLSEAKEMFEWYVRKDIEREEYSKRDARWKKETDCLSIAAVYNILPDVFEQRVLENRFDTSLLDGVKGWDYVVPLYYVTKAWDVLLHDLDGPVAFMIHPNGDDYDNYTPEEIKEILEEEQVKRTRQEAIEQNNKMKVLWLKHFNIDIDALEVDFRSFDMHLSANASHREICDYFLVVPEGLVEWALIPARNWQTSTASSARNMPEQ